MDTAALFDEIAKSIPTGNRRANFLNCGATDDKTGWYQVLVGPRGVRVGLVFDSTDAHDNAVAWQRCKDMFAAEIKSGAISAGRKMVGYVFEMLTSNPAESIPQTAKRVLDRLAWWRKRVESQDDEAWDGR